MSRSAPDTYLGTTATVTAPLPNAPRVSSLHAHGLLLLPETPASLPTPLLAEWEPASHSSFFLGGGGGNWGGGGGIARQLEMGSTGSRHWSRVWIVFVPCLFCDVIRFVLLWCRFWGPERLWRIHKQGELTQLGRRLANNKGHKRQQQTPEFICFRLLHNYSLCGFNLKMCVNTCVSMSSQFRDQRTRSDLE